MIPFPKSKSKPAVDESIEIDVSFDDASDVDLESGELELTDEDFILLDAMPAPAPISRSILRAALAAVPVPSNDSAPASQRSPRPTVERERRRSSPSRLSWDEEAESHVADECLASIAAEASRARGSDPFLFIAEASSSALPVDERDRRFIGRLPPASTPPFRAAGESRPRLLAPLSSSSILPRLPPVSAPPYQRDGRVPLSRGSVPGELHPVASPEKTPFARRTTDERASLSRSTPAGAVSSSVPPVAMGGSEGTVIVLRDRPRTPWIIASAAVGALVALTVMRLLVPPAASPTTPAAATPVPSTPIVAPKVVHFSEDEGVSIKVAAPAAPPAVSAARSAAPAHTAHAPAARPPTARPGSHGVHAPTPRVSAPTLLPDGSLGLANNSKAASNASAAPAAPAPTPIPLPIPAARKRTLTPEQELAEAQLRAAAR